MSSIKNRKKRLVILSIVLLALLLPLLIFFFFDIGKVIESKMRERLYDRFPGTGDISIDVDSHPTFKIWCGVIDVIRVRAKDLQGLPLTIRELNMDVRDVRIDVMRLLRKEIPSCITTLHSDGFLLIDESSLSEYLMRKSPPFTVIQVAIMPAGIHLTVKTKLIDIASLKGTFAVHDSTRIELEIPEIEIRSRKMKEEYLNFIKKFINPVIDFEDLNLASSIFRNMSEFEKKKWDVKVTEVQVGEGVIQVQYCVEKKEKSP